MAAGLFIYPLTSKKQFVSTISLSANENNFITEDKIDQISEDRREIKNEQWLKKFYKMMKSCLLYTSDAADEEDSVDLGGRSNIKKKTNIKKKKNEHSRH